MKPVEYWTRECWCSKGLDAAPGAMLTDSSNSEPSPAPLFDETDGPSAGRTRRVGMIFCQSSQLWRFCIDGQGVTNMREGREGKGSGSGGAETGPAAEGR